MEKRWLSKEEEKKVRKEIIWNIPGYIFPGVLILGILLVGLFTDPKVCGYAAVIFLPVAGILFWLAFREFRALRRITQKRYVIREFEVVDTKTEYTAEKHHHFVTLCEVGTEKVEKSGVFSQFYVLENNKYVYGIEIEGRKKRIYIGGGQG